MWSVVTKWVVSSQQQRRKGRKKNTKKVKKHIQNEECYFCVYLNLFEESIMHDWNLKAKQIWISPPLPTKLNIWVWLGSLGKGRSIFLFFLYFCWSSNWRKTQPLEWPTGHVRRIDKGQRPSQDHQPFVVYLYPNLMASYVAP